MPGDTESEERKKFDARWKEHYRPHTGARRVPPEATRATAEFFWLERARRARAEAEGLRELIRHAWVHTAYSDCGYQQMTMSMKALYCQVIGRTEGPNYQRPVECIKCGSATGPLRPVDAECAGWICPDCYAALAREPGERAV